MSTNQNWRTSWSLIARRTIWWYLFKKSRPYFSKTSRRIILKVYQSWFNIPCGKYISKFCFYFSAYSLAILSHMISTVFSKLSQYRAFTWRFWSRLCRKLFSFKWDLAILGRIKNVWASFKRNIALIRKYLCA